MDARPITALLIEDDVAWTTLIKVVLTQSKEVQFAVTCASCLEEGLRRCSEQSFDVVLLDLNLPDSRGPETLTRLYQHVPTVPILALTSRRDERVALEAMKAGAQDYLPKSSLNTDLLVRTIRYAIERKRAAEALRASEERFRLLAENAQDMIFRYEMVPRRGFSYVNPAATHLTGYAREEFYADPDLPFQYVHPDHHAELRRMLQGEAIKPSTVWRFRHRDGSLLWVESYRTPIYDGDGRLVAVEGINRDITERKRGEERLLRAQRLEAAGLVAAQVAHDFNNLLAPLTGYPELIKNRLPPDHPAVAYCDAMLEAAQRMAEINQDLLTLGRRGRATREVVDLNRIVEEALAQVSTWPAAIALKLHLAEGLLPVDGSAVQFLRMVINLVNNAREAIEREGEVEIRTENVVLQRWDGRLRLPAGAYVRLVVRDTGCGIPPEIRDSIFEPFFTTKASGRRRGSGLGLSIVHAVVEDHGGAVDLESEVGRGTTFAVYLPAAGAERSKTPPEAPLTRLASNGGETVLVVDDDQEQRLRVRQLLEALGYHVVAAAHGEEAVAYLGRHPVDLVVLDVGSAPGADGAETYRRMLEVRPGQRAIVVSSNARSEAVRQAQALGAGARLCKPLSLERLGRAVREELDRGRR